MKKISFFLILIFNILYTTAYTQENFQIWLNEFKLVAIKNGVSQKTVNSVMNDAKFLSKVIEYYRYQPEFYEDTFTYISKRANKVKVSKGLYLYNKQQLVIKEIEKKFSIEKELLLALMGIETNYGKDLGKMHIVSSLATLSYDKRRSDFFTNELLTLLKLVDQDIINKDILYGSWAGAFGNFQFMPTTIKNYAIDYNGNNDIELKKIDDSFASAANYMSKIGWKKDKPCFYKIELKQEIPTKYLNSSAKKLRNKRKPTKTVETNDNH